MYKACDLIVVSRWAKTEVLDGVIGITLSIHLISALMTLIKPLMTLVNHAFVLSANGCALIIGPSWFLTIGLSCSMIETL